MRDHTLVRLELLPDIAPVRLLVLQPRAEVFVRVGATVHVELRLLVGRRRLLLLAQIHTVLDFGGHRDRALPGKVLNISHLEELTHVLLFELVVLSFDSLVKPLWIFDAWARVQTLLKSSRNRNDLLDGAPEPLFVVIPVKQRPQIEVLQPSITGPLPHEFLHDVLAGFEDGSGNCSISNLGRQRLLGDDKLNVETLVFDNLRPKHFRQPACTGQ